MPWDANPGISPRKTEDGERPRPPRGCFDEFQSSTFGGVTVVADDRVAVTRHLLPAGENRVAGHAYRDFDDKVNGGPPEEESVLNVGQIPDGAWWQ